jgi:hypothetical protein
MAASTVGRVVAGFVIVNSSSTASYRYSCERTGPGRGVRRVQWPGPAVVLAAVKDNARGSRPGAGGQLRNSRLAEDA